MAGDQVAQGRGARSDGKPEASAIVRPDPPSRQAPDQPAEMPVGLQLHGLIDAVVAWGDVDRIAVRVRQHLDAGADHVCVQVVSEDELDPCLPQLRELAPALLEL